MRAQNNFKKGAVEMLLLHILKEQGDCYGYQFSKLIKELSDDYLTVPEGSLYPALDVYKRQDTMRRNRTKPLFSTFSSARILAATDILYVPD